MVFSEGEEVMAWARVTAGDASLEITAWAKRAVKRAALGSGR